MKKHLTALLLLIATCPLFSTELDWTVIGAGPAGIAAVGKLIDHGIPADHIGWIDPYFQVGDFGRKWSEVPGNTRIEIFLRFLNNCKAFNFTQHASEFYLQSLPPKETCALKYVIEPMQWITDHLRTQVHSFQTMATALSLSQNRWVIKTEDESLYSKNVILAIGCECKTLPIEGPEMISLETALNPEKLKEAVSPDDIIAVFGSSHSAVLALANLMELNPNKVINFYRSPLKYAVYLDDWILFDNTGLKGFSAKWAKENLDGTWPDNLTRVLVSDPTSEILLGLCTKAIYAVGFQRRTLPVLEQYGELAYEDHTGIIAPGLFGVGFAFPQAKTFPLGQVEHRVGLWKFIDYLNLVLPIWISYSND